MHYCLHVLQGSRQSKCLENADRLVVETGHMRCGRCGHGFSQVCLCNTGHRAFLLRHHSAADLLVSPWHCLTVLCPKVTVVSAVSEWCSCFAVTAKCDSVWPAISLAPSLIWSKVSDMSSAIRTARLTAMASVAPSWIIDSMSWGKCLFFLCRLELRLPNTKVVSALICLTLSAIVWGPRLHSDHASWTELMFPLVS